MKARDKLRQRVQPHLRAGEHIQALFLAKRRWGYSQGADRIVVATDQRFVLFSIDFLGRIKPLEETVRSVRIGPARGWLACNLPLFREQRLEVTRGFFRDIDEADRALAQDRDHPS